MNDPGGHKAVKAMIRGSIRSLALISADLQKPDSDLDAVSFWLSELITRRPLVTFMGHGHPDLELRKLREELAGNTDAGFVQDLITRSNRPGSFRFIVVCLYEEDFGDTRATIRFLAQQRGMNGVNYLTKLTRAVARLEGRADWVKDPKTMFDGSFRAAVDRLLARGASLKELSGLTHTALKTIYEWAFAEPACNQNGFADVRAATYDAGYDLGGGFATQYLADRFAKPLECLDLFDVRTRAPEETGHVAAEYAAVGMKFDREAAPFRRFDVHRDDYPLDHERYLITSFGFIGSTPADLSTGRVGKDGIFATIYAAARGIAKLVVAKKDVTLCVYARPTAARFMNLCWTARFVEGRLASLRTITSDCFVDLSTMHDFAANPHTYGTFAVG